MAYNPKDFGYKDSLPSGDPEKVIKGVDFDTEFQAIKRELDKIDHEMHPDGGDSSLITEPPNTGKNYVRQGGTATWREIGTEFINDTNFVSEEGIKDLGAESRRWHKLWVGEIDAFSDVHIGGNINVDGNANIDGALEIHGNIIIDGGQVVDPDGNPAGGIGAGSNIGDVPKWNGSEWVPTFYKTNDLNDVESETASKGQLLVHNGTQWVAGDFNLDDLKDVNAGTPTKDDLIIWNGTNWVADDFSFIQTALRFKGGISPTAAAPTNPEGGDLYVFDSNGTVSGSWGDIAGREVQAGKFVGYAASTHNRWYLLGDMADVGVMDVSAGIGINVDDSTPSEPVVSINRTEVDTWYEPQFVKNTAFNKNFGTAAGTVAEGNHTHSEYVETETDPTVPQHVKDITTTQIANWDTAYGWGNHATQGYLKAGDVPNTDLSNYYTKGESDGKYEPKFTKNNAFNKNFGTAAGTVAKGDHTHSEYASKGDSYTKAESDAKYEQKGAGGGGGGLPAGDWHCTGNITAVGNITAYYSSDERLKDDITAMPVGLIDGIEPVTWKWKEGGKKSGGVVAQQLQQCGLGNWVNEAPDGTLGVDYNALIGVLLAEVISLKKEVKDLKDAVA